MPQTPARSRIRRLACLSGLVAIASLAGCKEENRYVPPPPPQVGVSAPVQRAVAPYLEVTGNAAAYNSVNLVARIQGFLSEINYEDGAFVKKGTTLFVVEPKPYEAQFQQAQAELQSVQAQLLNAETELSRQGTLLRQNVTAQNTYDQALAKRDSLKADQLKDQAGVTLAAINYGYTRVTAPFDGVVTNHLVSVGALVGHGDPTTLATIVQLNPIYVTFNISEQAQLRVKAALVKAGKTLADLGIIPVEVGLMTEQGYPHKGKLDYVNPEIDPSTGTLLVRAVFDNPDRWMLPGNFARVRIPVELEEQKNALLVPDTALGANQAGRYLLVVNKDNVVEQRAVQVGQVYGGLRRIESGVTPEDRIVVTAIQRAIPGEKVAPEPVALTEQRADATPAQR